MIDVLQDEDSRSCIGCGKHSENYKDFRIIKISKDGRSSSCTGSLCKDCRSELLSKLMIDLT